jgi:hypothetical protein
VGMAGSERCAAANDRRSLTTLFEARTDQRKDLVFELIDAPEFRFAR